MKKTLLTLVCCMTIIAYANAATITFNGAGSSTDWMDPLNWDGGVIPTADDDARIDDFAVTLDANTTVQRINVLGSGSLTIGASVTLNIDGFTGDDDGFEVNNSATVINEGTINVSNISGNASEGVYVRGTFTNNGVITVDAIGRHGLYVQRGNFINSSLGTITISNYGQTNNDGDGLYVDASSGVFGLMTNQGMVIVNTSSGDDGLYVNNGSTFNNEAIVSVSGTGKNGLRLDDDSTFNNMMGAMFNVDGLTDDQILVDDSNANFNNFGTINLTNPDAGDAGLYVIDNGTFTNMASGVVNITDAENYGIQIDANGGSAEIINLGTMIVTTSSNDGMRIQEGGLFTNNGTLTFDTVGDEGIEIENPGTVNNTGTINIDSPVGHGMEISDTYSNIASGTLNITNAPRKGILMIDGSTLNNSGIIDIDGVVEEGLDMVDCTFNNMPGAVFKARNITDDGLEINGPSIFNNDGHIDIDGSLSEDIEIISAPTLNNSSTATYTPGSSPGDLEVRGDFDLGASTTTFEIDGTTAVTDYDQIDNSTSSNTITISGATAHLVWGYTPAVGDCFKIIDGSGSVAGEFASITSSDPSILFEVDYTSNTDEVTICAIDALPVELVRFTAEKTDKGAQLSWETASELNNQGFDIERSNDGRSWAKIANVEGRGNSTERVRYSFLDEKTTEGDNYYRLKQNDFDGNFEYSNVASLNFGNNKTGISFYPNPVKDVLFVDMNQESEDTEIQLLDYTGKVLWTNTGVVHQIPFDNYATGIYFLSVTSSTDRTVQRVIKN